MAESLCGCQTAETKPDLDFVSVVLTFDFDTILDSPKHLKEMCKQHVFGRQNPHVSACIVQVSGSGERIGRSCLCWHGLS